MKGIYGDDAETLQALNLMIDKGIDGYRETQKKMAAQATLQQRVNAQLGTLGNLWDAATGTFTNALVNFGEAISPELKTITEWLGDVSEKLANWSKRNPELSNTIMKMTAIIAGLLVAIGGLIMMLAAVLGPLAMTKFAFTVLGIKLPAFGSAITTLLSPLKWLTSAFIRLGKVRISRSFLPKLTR